MQPAVFIGSSSEGLEYARAARRLLDDVAAVRVWKELSFGLSNTIIEGLVQHVERFDFAVLILTADDLLTSRDSETLSPRDNVIFELGMFMGSLGRPRTFLLQQIVPDVKVPSDLSGVITAPFKPREEDETYDSAIGRACDLVRERIRDLGVSPRKVSREIDELASRQRVQGEELSHQKTQIESLQIALRGIVTGYELDKLNGLRQERFEVRYSEDLISELRHLRAMGLVQNRAGTGLRTITERYRNRPGEFDLRDHFCITEQGSEYLRVRTELEALAAAP
jgi:CAP12/Pycsar effector protein, TIR domain